MILNHFFPARSGAPTLRYNPALAEERCDGIQNPPGSAQSPRNGAHELFS